MGPRSVRAAHARRTLTAALAKGRDQGAGRCLTGAVAGYDLIESQCLQGLDGPVETLLVGVHQVKTADHRPHPATAVQSLHMEKGVDYGVMDAKFSKGEVAAIMQLGSLLEELTVAKARAGIERLVRLTPRTARVISGGTERVIPAQEVRVGDVLRVLPGESVPVEKAPGAEA